VATNYLFAASQCIIEHNLRESLRVYNHANRYNILIKPRRFSPELKFGVQAMIQLSKQFTNFRVKAELQTALQRDYKLRRPRENLECRLEDSLINSLELRHAGVWRPKVPKDSEKASEKT
jgi:hypothetical protein